MGCSGHVLTILHSFSAFLGFSWFFGWAARAEKKRLRREVGALADIVTWSAVPGPGKCDVSIDRALLPWRAAWWRSGCSGHVLTILHSFLAKLRISCFLGWPGWATEKCLRQHAEKRSPGQYSHLDCRAWTGEMLGLGGQRPGAWECRMDCRGMFIRIEWMRSYNIALFSHIIGGFLVFWPALRGKAVPDAASGFTIEGKRTKQTGNRGLVV